MGFVQDRSIERPNSKTPFKAFGWNAVAKRKVTIGSFATWEQADAAWRAYERRADQDYAEGLGQPVQRRKPTAPTLMDHGLWWLTLERLDRYTQNKYEGMLRRMIYALGHGEYPRSKKAHMSVEEVRGCDLCSQVKVTTVQKTDTQWLYVRLQESMQFNGLRNYIYLLRQIFRSALDNDWRSDDPTVWGQSRKLKQQRSAAPVTLTAGDVERLADAMPGPSRLAVWLGVYAGLRSGEVCALLAEDANLDRRWMRIYRIVEFDRAIRDTTKYGGDKAVPIFDALAPKIKEHLELYGTADTGELVYDERTGQRLNNQQFATRLRKARRAAELNEKLVFRHLRHRFATMLGAHESTYVVANLMRHEHASTSDQYTHVTVDEVTKKRLDRVFQAEAG